MARISRGAMSLCVSHICPLGRDGGRGGGQSDRMRGEFKWRDNYDDKKSYRGRDADKGWATTHIGGGRMRGGKVTTEGGGGRTNGKKM